MTVVHLYNSKNKSKRYTIIFGDGSSVSFGSPEHENFTIHKNPERKRLYIARHEKNENWNKSGIKTAGFWSRWLLWNKPSIAESARDIEQKFGISIINKISQDK